MVVDEGAICERNLELIVEYVECVILREMLFLAPPNAYLCKCSFTGAKTSKLAGTSWYNSANLSKVERQWLKESTLQKKKRKQFYDSIIHGFCISFYFFTKHILYLISSLVSSSCVLSPRVVVSGKGLTVLEL